MLETSIASLFLKITPLALSDSVNPCAFAVLVLVLISILTHNPEKRKKILLGGLAFVSVDVAKCIGSNSQLYVQLGCHFCAEQEQIFGDSWKYLNVTDCYYNASLCNSLNIQGTPTWIVNGTKYLGVQSIDKLKQLTGC